MIENRILELVILAAPLIGAVVLISFWRHRH